MADLRTCYMGLELDNPIIVAASGLTASESGVRKAIEAGAGAVVLKSLFEEQLKAELRDAQAALDEGAHSEAYAFLNRGGMDEGAGDYIDMLRSARSAAGSVPIIASLNCRGAARWADFAAQIEKAGADALELNIAFMPYGAEEDAAALEKLLAQVVRDVCDATDLPVAVKLGQGYTSLPNVAKALSKAGAKGLVLFNRFYSLDIDLATMALKAGPVKSSADDFHESLRWIAILADRVDCDLAAGTGVHHAETLVKLVLAGARAVQVCSLLYQKGWPALAQLKQNLDAWLAAKGEASIGGLHGRLSQWRSEDPEVYLRLQYIKALTGIS